MEEKNEEKQSDFKAVKNPVNVKTVKSKNEKKGSGFGRSFLLPFISGVLGCSVVIGTCFGIPSIKNSILSNDSNNSTINNTSSNSSNTLDKGYVNQSSLSNYSDTSVFAANKILPSIVGIKVEYNVNSMFSMFSLFWNKA